jgi:type VI protein secretion system component Hcp
VLACAEGEHIKKAVLTCRKAGKEQQEFLKVTMSDVLVSSYQTSGSANGDEVPTTSEPELLQDRVRVQGPEGRRHARRDDQGRLRRQGHDRRSDRDHDR